MNEFLEILKGIVTNPYVIIFGSVTLIEVVPIKIKPWSWLMNWLGERLCGDIRRALTEMKTEFEEYQAEDMRWSILDFARSCRKKEQHSKEEWNHAISQLKKYETYTKEKHIDNGVIEEDGEYLRELYHERCIKNDFL